jgi:hypothetical protein
MKFIKICECWEEKERERECGEGMDGIMMIMMWREKNLISHANTICTHTYEYVHEVSHHIFMYERVSEKFNSGLGGGLTSHSKKS